MWTIRPAREDDALALSELAESTFRDAFGAMNSAEDMDLHCSRAYAPEVLRGEIVDPATHLLLAEEAGALLGYAQVHRGAAPPCVTAELPVELARIYVRRAWHGSGVAGELMDAVVDHARAVGGDVLWLGVWERNPRAIQFYLRRGFTAVGEKVFQLGNDPQRDRVMTLPLDGGEKGIDEP